MKHLVLAAAVIVFAACAKSEEAPAADTPMAAAADTPAAAAAPTDTTMKADSGAKKDTTKM